MEDKYKKAYNVLMEHWDSFSDDEKKELDEVLRAIGL